MSISRLCPVGFYALSSFSFPLLGCLNCQAKYILILDNSNNIDACKVKVNIPLLTKINSGWVKDLNIKKNYKSSRRIYNL